LPALPRRQTVTAPALPQAEVASAASVRRLRLDVARRLDGLLHGDHLGHLPGPGTEPGEARTYVPGDDVRRIDWAVTARAGDVYVRTPVAERELETTVVVDLTPSMSFGTARTEKREVAVVLTAALAHLAHGPGDRVGAVVLSDRVRRVPARPGRDAELALLHVLRAARPADSSAGASAGPTLSEGLHLAASTARRRGLMVVVSDLIEPGPAGAEPSWAGPLRLLGTRHDLVVVEVVDPRELELPAVGVLRLVDPESGQQLDVDTGKRRVRERYAAAAVSRRDAHAAAVRRAGGTHVVVRTDRDWLPDLARALAARRRLRAAGRALR
jgi:uncharacterized protein (DUF58 family)